MEPLLATRYVFTITAHVAGIVSVGDIGTGERRIIPIVGGEVRCKDINGKVCAFGADLQIVRPDSSIELEAKYALETDDGAVIYFRTVPKFETGVTKYRWLMQSLFVASAARHTDRVVLDVHQVL